MEFKELVKSNEEMTKTLQETRKSLKRSNAAVRELFVKYYIKPTLLLNLSKFSIH